MVGSLSWSTGEGWVLRPIGMPGIDRSNSGTTGDLDPTAECGCEDSSSFFEGRLAHTMPQTRHRPTIDTTLAVTFPDDACCVRLFILAEDRRKRMKNHRKHTFKHGRHRDKDECERMRLYRPASVFRRLDDMIFEPGAAFCE